MSRTVFLEYRRPIEIASLVADASAALQTILGMSWRTPVRGWAIRRFDPAECELVLEPPGKHVEDQPRLVFRTLDGDELVSVRHKSNFLLPEAEPPVPTVFVESSGARTAADLALGAALIAAFARLLDTPIFDPEGCYGGPRLDTANSFVTRIAVKSSFSDYASAVSAFAAGLAFSDE